MSTKNLARTVIEGGRARFNRFERHHSNAVERAHAHQLERRLCASLTAEDAIFQPRQPVRPSFDDKLGPAKRWLRSQVGRPWNKVRSELFERFDARTTAGRHILFDHLLDDVQVDEEVDQRYFYLRPFHVSPHGILRYRGRRRWAGWPRPEPLPELERALRAWLGSRRVIERDAVLYWLVPTPHGGFRQHLRLDDADSARFRALPSWFREQFLGAVRTEQS